jgi:hypothetical protein
VYKILSNSSPRVLASQPWFLFEREPDFHLLSQTSAPTWAPAGSLLVPFVIGCGSEKALM